MELSLYIYNFLQERTPRVEVPNFGIFRLEKTHAMVDAEASKILPPSEHIYFEDNTNVFDSSLAHYIAEKTGENLFVVQSQLRDIVGDWIKILLTQKKLKLNHLGEFTLNEIEIVLEDSKNEQSIDFFGLEEVSVTKVEELRPVSIPTETPQKVAKVPVQTTSSNKGMIWLVVGLLLVLAAAILFINKDSLFGAKDTEEQPTQNTETVQPTNVEPVIKDSVTIDSVQIEY